jgi:hypothetical protein
MSRLFREDHPIKILQKQDEEVREAFYQRFNQKEQYQFVLLYKYAVLSKVIMDTGKEEPDITQEQLKVWLGWF